MFHTTEPSKIDTSDTVYIKIRNNNPGGDLFVAVDAKDASRLKFAHLYMAPSGYVRVRFAGWTHTRMLDKYLVGHRCRHSNGDPTDFRRENLLALDS